jgi:hypothetical protein
MKHGSGPHRAIEEQMERSFIRWFQFACSNRPAMLVDGKDVLDLNRAFVDP